VQVLDDAATVINAALSKSPVDAPATKELLLVDEYVPMGAMTETFQSLRAQVNRELVSLIYDSSAEISLVLQRPRAPIDIVVTEGGATAGNVDALLAKFIKINSLHAKEILLLPVGSEVRLAT
jgi:hypothetical protein